MSPLEAHVAAFPPGSADIVLNALPHPVLMIGADGKIADANVAAEAFFEVSMPLLRRQLIDSLFDVAISRNSDGISSTSPLSGQFSVNGVELSLNRLCGLDPLGPRQQ